MSDRQPMDFPEAVAMARRASERQRASEQVVPPSVIARMADKVRLLATGCWEWQASMCKGYGQLRVSGRTRYAHRLVYAFVHGAIPEGHEIDHLCRNPACVNPQHLEAVTPWVNNMRSNSAASRNSLVTHCPQGHRYDAANTYVYANGSRKCRACRAECERERLRRRRGA